MSLPSSESFSSGRLSADRFRFGSEFASPELEHQYRESQLSSHKQAARWCIVAMIFGSFVFGTSDIRLFGWSTELYMLWTIRFLTLGLCLMALLVIRKTQAP